MRKEGDKARAGVEPIPWILPVPLPAVAAIAGVCIRRKSGSLDKAGHLILVDARIPDDVSRFYELWSRLGPSAWGGGNEGVAATSRAWISSPERSARLATTRRGGAGLDAVSMQAPLAGPAERMMIQHDGRHTPPFATQTSHRFTPENAANSGHTGRGYAVVSDHRADIGLPHAVFRARNISSPGYCDP